MILVLMIICFLIESILVVYTLHKIDNKDIYYRMMPIICLVALITAVLCIIRVVEVIKDI